MPSDRPSRPLKWFLLAAAFALVMASSALLLTRGSAEKNPSPHDINQQQELPPPVAQIPPVRPHEEFVPPKQSDQPKQQNPAQPPPEASSSFSSGGGSGQGSPKPSVVSDLPSLWSLMYRPWILVVASVSIVMLIVWQVRERRHSRVNSRSS